MNWTSNCGWLEIHPFRWSSILEYMTTHVRRIARCMPCVNREPAAKEIKMLNIGIKQARITNLEIRLQADCAVNSCANYSWFNSGSVMSVLVKFHPWISNTRTLPQGKVCRWAEHRWRCWLVGNCSYNHSLWQIKGILLSKTAGVESNGTLKFCEWSGCSVNRKSIPCKRRGEIVCSGGRVGGKEGDKLCRREVYCSKGSYKFVGGVNWLGDDKVGSWFFRFWTSNNEFDLRRARTEGKTEGTSELDTIDIVLVEY